MKNLKSACRWAAIVLAGLLLGACASNQTAAEKAAAKAHVAQAVADSVALRQFTVDVNYLNPQSMPPRPLTYGYSVSIRGNRIESRLPFFGRVFQAEYGQQTGLNFEAEVAQYHSTLLKKDCLLVEVLVYRNSERLLYRFEIFNNGRTSLTVTSNNRDAQYFSGELITE